jgi:hypothetical protein
MPDVPSYPLDKIEEIPLKSLARQDSSSVYVLTTLYESCFLFRVPGPPFRSTLEPHLEFITQERRKRLTWKAIAAAIQAKGTPCTPQGVQDYFRRRKIGKRKLPLGFEPDQPQAHVAFPDPATKRPDMPADHPESEGDVYDDALEAHLGTQQKQATPPRRKIQPGTKL